MSTALYRRYRPETFADVIGQEHVTDPLMAALRSDRITHAYLFSGPRGCGKTTSARIFARCLNCAEGPTDTPCGTCDSCVDLARGGAGSLDVVEMDAASHGGVDDARELRERAAFAPARDRYKVFIIDEAHMVTSQGFNALLKLVEEPPAHVKFVFATTEPEKVIGTIRSRTHHYPFRLVPPERLQGYLEQLCTAEGITVATGVLPLVVRAGGGSVRDSLSVLDQLMAGAQDGEVSYERAVALLGYTHATMLDDVVDALAARDGASLFRVVDRVIDSGHDPRRFAEDLLERLRDLVIIAVSGEQAAAVLRALPQDQFERMRGQAQQLGPAELSRAGDLINAALSEMSGATSPRLQLELLCARLLLPGADDASRGHGARLDRIERHLSAGGGPARGAAPRAPQPVDSAPRGPQQPAGAAEPGPGQPSVAPESSQASRTVAPERSRTPVPGTARESGSAPERASEPARTPVKPEPSRAPASASASEPAPAPEPAPTAEPAPTPEPAGRETDARPATPAPAAAEQTAPAEEAAPAVQAAPAGEAAPAEAHRPEREPAPAPAWEPAPAREDEPAPAREQRASERPEAPTEQAAPAAPGSTDAELIRRRWPEVLATLAQLKRSTWALVSQNASVADVSSGVLHLAFTTSGLAHTFRNGLHVEPLQRALLETLGVQVRIEPVLSQAAEAGAATGNPYAAPSAAPSPGWSTQPSTEPAGAPWQQDRAAPADGAGAPPQVDHGPGSAGPVAGPASSASRSPHSAPSPAGAARPGTAGPSSSARDADEPRSGGGRVASAAAAGPVATVSLADDTPSMDDPDAENSGLVGAQLIERMLGGTVIEEE